MNYHDHHEWAGWLASIREQPDDDNRRLFCADWLDELETEVATERAEFIRVQCELAKTPELVWRNKLIHRAEWDTIRQRAEPWGERFVLASPADTVGVYHYRETNPDYVRLYGRMSALADGIYGSLLGPVALAGGTWVVCRGFVTSVSAPLSVLNGERCRCMEYTKLTGPCDCCGGTGRTPGVLGELLRREPITAAGVVVTDATPIMDSGLWFWGKLGNTSLTHAHWLPDAVWQMSHVVSKSKEPGRGDRYVAFPTSDAARLALGKALFRLHGPKSEVVEE